MASPPDRPGTPGRAPPPFRGGPRALAGATGRAPLPKTPEPKEPRTPNPPTATAAARSPLPATPATRTPLPVTATITAASTAITAPQEPVRNEPLTLSAADVRAIVGDVTGAAVAILRSECEALSARLAKVEERLTSAEKGLAAAATRPQQTTLVGTGPMVQPGTAPPPIPAQPQLAVAAPAAVAQVAPAFAAAAAVAPASVRAPAPAAPAVPPVKPRAPEIQFDLTPDDTDLPFATGASRQRRVLFMVLLALLLVVGFFVVSAIVSQANYVH